MINLLPPGVKQDIAYARKNNGLLHYCFFAVIVIIGMAVITVGGVFYMQRSRKAYQDQVARSTTSLQSQHLESIQKQAEEISGNIKLTTDVLSRQVLFSKLLKQIGAAMPAKTSLSDLKITTGESGITLTAAASDYNSASQVQINLADPSNKIFKKADLVSINCDKSTTQYPCTVVIRALFGDNSSYLFIKPDKAKS